MTIITRQWRGPWGRKTTAATVTFFSLLLGAAYLIYVPKGSNWTLDQSTGRDGCNFPAIFNFGDSNSDTGGKSAAFRRRASPNGDTFFHKPSGRYSDGRVIVDFVAEKLGLPYLSAYLDSIGSNFRHGANFATGGSTIQPVDSRIFAMGFSPMSLDIQLLQFEQFKARSIELYKEAENSYIRSRLPRPEDFSKALYTLDIGQNDLHAGFGSMSEEEVKASIPNIIEKFAHAVERLYEIGARAFWIHNTGPIGCLPYSIIHYSAEPGNTDQNGCVKSHNEVSKEYNQQLKERVSQLRIKFSDAVLTYVDIHAAKSTIISEANRHGFMDPLGYCCGHYGNYTVECGKKTVVNGAEVFGTSCSNPSVYISWDGVHYTEAANKWIAKHILDGSVSEPPVPITEEQKIEWGKGLAQKREAEARLKELEHEKDKPFAQTRDDPDFDKMLKDRLRWGDPTAHLVKKRHSEPVLRNLGDDEKMKESGFVIPREIPSHSWIRRGLDAAPNRYGIRPGRQWDGVDRSNSFEKELFKKMNEKQATEREADLWSVSDM